jgi:hypothetical protein
VETLDSKRRELEELLSKARQLETEIAETAQQGQWPPRGFYWAYYATSGFMLGLFGAMASLLVNVIGAPIAGKSPLELIRIYLTFPLGEHALTAGGDEGGLVLALGCCLYLATGMVLGVPFFVLLGRFAKEDSLKQRLIVATGLAISMWLVHFYGILIWLQPALLGGNWITDPALLPPWVAAATHLVFGWTLAVMYPLGKFVPYRQPAAPAT